ncbi:MAG: aspartate/glutamate racemase family protein [Woeseiaceae bacterium]|nr:aspartate/glutamate racemase family protein [Woeseiaceae bacterium]
MTDSGAAKRILIINPNSNTRVTEEIDRSVDAERRAAELDIVCVDLPEAPQGIESDEDIAAVEPLVERKIHDESTAYDAFVIACYSDPGLRASRAATDKLVFGIQESAADLAASYGKRFGVLALSRDSIQRHIAYIRSIGLHEFHAGERPLGISVAESVADPQTLDKIVATGRELIEADGAELLVLGCAGMVRHRAAAQERLGVPVIDPVLAAVKMAKQSLGQLQESHQSGESP